jgi:7,8-dihydroneopterin aldolase/epimerase/oxygenase
MTDRIAIRGIRAFGRHGANPGEQDVPQPFDVDVDLEVDLERSVHTDALDDTLDYRDVHRIVGEVIGTGRFTLLERIAQEIAREILHNDHVNAVTVTIAKPGLLSGATPSVTLRRTR